MTRRFAFLTVLILLVAGLLTGCVGGTAPDSAEPTATIEPLSEPMYTDRNALYQYYNQVGIGDTLDALKDKFGEPELTQTDGGDSYTWVMDDGYGFAAAFFDSGRLRAKVLYYKDIRQLGQLSEATNITGYASLSSNYTYEMTCGVLGGKPMEIAQIAQDSSEDPEVKRLFAWCTPKGDCVQILFSGKEMVESVSSLIVED